MCLVAIKQNGFVLQYVLEQTPEICLKAVRQNGHALRYVNEQTEEICLEAVKQDVRALQYVKEDMFKEENNEIEIDGKTFSKDTIKAALKQYISF